MDPAKERASNHKFIGEAAILDLKVFASQSLLTQAKRVEKTRSILKAVE